MLPVLSAARVRSAEAAVMELLPEGALMQRAARALAVRCVDLLREQRGAVRGACVAILAGSGNNGGDALWAGAYLAQRGCAVRIVPVTERTHEEGMQAALKAGALLSLDHERTMIWADLVIDGIVGIGGAGPVREPAAALLPWASGALVVAVDIPSGVDADTGCVHEPAVVADLTVTFGALKPGLLLAPDCVGEVDLVDIGLTFTHEDYACAVLESDDVAQFLSTPVSSDYKYSRGVVGIAAGSAAYPGAAQLCVGGALPSGVGMVRLWNRGDGSAQTVVAKYPSVIADDSFPRSQRAQAWVCGPGLGTDAASRAHVKEMLSVDVPLVLDASALTVLADDPDLRSKVKQRSAITVLTPHSGEFARLFPHIDTSDRLHAARQAAAEMQCFVALKGAGTVIASPEGMARIDTQGGPELATAGSGDVLAGLIGGLLAQGTSDPVDRIAAAVWLHGLAGAQAARDDEPVTAETLLMRIPSAIAKVRRDD